MRAFYAFPIPEDTIAGIQSFLKPFVYSYTDIKWVKRQALHITVLFLGEITEDQAARCADLLHNPGMQREPITVRFKGMATFPPRGRPRVLYAPLLEGFSECMAVYEELFDGVERSILGEKRRYTPHITLGRVKGRGAVPQREEFSDLYGSFIVKRCVLYQSVLKSDGPEYREIDAAEFTEKKG